MVNLILFIETYDNFYWLIVYSSLIKQIILENPNTILNCNSTYFHFIMILILWSLICNVWSRINTFVACWKINYWLIELLSKNCTKQMDTILNRLIPFHIIYGPMVIQKLQRRILFHYCFAPSLETNFSRLIWI